MDENQFWIKLWSIVGAAAVAIAITIGVSSHHSEEKVVQMVNNGANPIQARCAIYGVHNTTCTIESLKTKEEL